MRCPRKAQVPELRAKTKKNWDPRRHQHKVHKVKAAALDKEHHHWIKSQCDGSTACRFQVLVNISVWNGFPMRRQPKVKVPGFHQNAILNQDRCNTIANCRLQVLVKLSISNENTMRRQRKVYVQVSVEKQTIKAASNTTPAQRVGFRFCSKPHFQIKT